MSVWLLKLSYVEHKVLGFFGLFPMLRGTEPSNQMPFFVSSLFRIGTFHLKYSDKMRGDS